MKTAEILIDAAGKVLLITGAAGGIGGAISDMYHAAGGRIMGVDRIAALERERQISCVCDGADEAALADAVAQTIKSFGRLDAAVHTIGISAAGPLASMSLQAWDDVMNVNLTSAFLLARLSYPHLRASNGSLVFIASSSGRNGGTTATGPAYAASKAGMINLARYLAKEWAPDGIRVNVVAPGPVMTPMMAVAGSERQSEYANTMLTGALAEPREIAAAVCYLLSGHARSMTGSIFNPSGGLVLD